MLKWFVCFAIVLTGSGRMVAGLVEVKSVGLDRSVVTIGYTGVDRLDVYAEPFTSDGRLAYCADLYHDNQADQIYWVDPMVTTGLTFPYQRFADSANRMAWLVDTAKQTTPVDLETVQLAIWWLEDRQLTILSGLRPEWADLMAGYDPTASYQATFLAARHDGLLYQDLIQPPAAIEPSNTIGWLTGCLAVFLWRRMKRG